MRKKLSKGLIAAAILTTCLSTPLLAAEYANLTELNGAAINNIGAVVDIEANSSFTNNTSTAQNYGGGAIYTSGGTVKIGSGTSFTNNHLNQPVTNTTDKDYRSAGGAIASWNSGTLNIGTDVTFTGNGTNSGTGEAAWASGGAIYADTNKTSLANVTIGSGTTFSYNKAGALGGAMYLGDANTSITSAIFSNNTAGSWGGAIFNGQYFGIIGNNLSVTGTTTFSENEAGKYGGAIASQYTTLNIGDGTNNIVFDGNIAGIDGGAVHITTDSDVAYQASSNINNATFINNEATTGSGGAIYNTATMTITNSKFGNVIRNAANEITGATNGNTAAVKGGAIFNNAGSISFVGSNEFAGNSAYQGGAVMNYGSGATVDLGDNSVFAYNTASSVGGAISTVDTGSAMNAGTIIGDNAQFIGNTSGTQGGAIHNQRANTKIGDNAVFQNNKAIGYGGGAIYQDTDGAATTLTIGNNAQFIGNSTESSHGGAIMSFRASADNNATLSIGEGASFENNTAAKTGGAISNFYGQASVDKGATFTGNTAGTNGGAIYNDDWGTYGATFTVNGDTEFTNNTASGQGGAIYNAAKMELNTTDGNITFTDNTANNVANDILAAASSVTNITGTNNVSIGSGLTTLTGSSLNIKDTSALVIESGAKADIAGAITSTANAKLVNNGETTISGTNNVNITNNADLTVSGNGASNITNNANTVLSGTYTGTLNQKDKNASVTIADGAIFSSAAVIEGGTLNIASGGILQGDLSVTDAVKINIEDGRSVIDSTGLVVGNSGHIVMSGTSSLNLSGDYTVSGGVLGTSVIISNGAINAQPAGPLTIDNSKVLTLSDNATSNGAFVVGANGTLKLAPKTGESLTLSSNNSVSGSGQVLVDEIIVTEQTYDPSTGTYTPTTLHYGVGTVNLANDNSGFSGTYLQKTGNVIAQAGSKFFGGTNTVEGGSLTLQKGADLTVDVSAKDNGNGGYGTINIYNDIEGTVGSDGINRIADTDITNGVIRYVNSDETTIKNVNITKAGLGLFNGTRVEGNSSGTLSLVSTAGVRDLTFGNGSGSEADVISLGNGTKLTYKDNAYIKDDSKVELGANTTLNFDNDTTNIEYRPVITSTDATALISQTGEGETVISSSLRDFNGSVNVKYGSLDLANEDAINVNNITADNGDLSIAADTTANNVTVGNDSEFVAKKSLTVNDTLTVDNSQATVNGETRALIANFKGSDSVVNLKGAAFFGNMNLNGATMNAYNNVNVTGTMTLSNNPTIGLANGGMNTINAGTLDMRASGANISFDADPRSLATDSIVVNNILNSSSPYKLLITGINLTTSPIDRNVNIDISNLLRDSTGSRADAIALRDGGVIARTAMGDYAITASSSSNMLNASLLAINPQMYRGQVATLASWQNQLVVNNMMFDHMQVVTRQLMDDAKTANKYSAILPQFAPYQYSAKDGSLWYKAYGNFERVSMTRGLSVGNNAYGSLIGADFPLVELKNGWKIVPTAFIGYNGGHQTYDGVSMYQNGAQLGLMGTAYKGNFLTSLLAYGGGYGNDMSVKGQYGGGSDTTGNWFAGVASKSAYNIHLPHDFIFQPTAMVTYNAFGNQNWGSSFGAMSMSTGMLNGINAAPGFNLIWNKKTFSIYATAQMVYNIMGGVDAKAGNIDLGYVRMRHSYFEYGLGVTKRFKDTFNGYLQLTFRNGGRTGVGFQGGIQWKPGRDKK